MTYSDKVIDHYNNPRNVGSFGTNEEAKKRKDLGIGIVGAPECGDVMKLALQVEIKYTTDKGNHYTLEEQFPIGNEHIFNETIGIEKIIGKEAYIKDAKFKAFGCGSAIASASLATEMLKGRTLDEALTIKNTQIVEELALPPVKVHCSVLAEDAIKAAVSDYKKKTETPSQV